MFISRHFIISLFVLFGLLTVVDGFSQKDNARKNAKISKAENERYEKDMKAHPNSAEPHWRHANIVGAYHFEEAGEAWRYYNQALKIDSTNAAIWTDFGDYLLRVYDDKQVALNLYERAQSLEPNNKDLQNKISELTKSVAKIEETIRLRSIGYSDRRKIDHGIKYSVISNLDSLQEITSMPDSPYSYERLLKRFIEDDLLNEWETYLLCLGYATTEDYSPYSDVSGDLYKFNKAGNYEKTIENAQELIKKNPVSPSLYRELMYAYRRKGDKETADRYQRRAQRLYEAMIFTGDGTCDTPYITLTTTEEYALINYLGFRSTGDQALMECNNAQTDRLKVKDQNGKEDELYFNVSLLFKRMSSMLEK